MCKGHLEVYNGKYQYNANAKEQNKLDRPLFSPQEGEIADMKFFFEKLINTGFLEGSALKSVIG